MIRYLLKVLRNGFNRHFVILMIFSFTCFCWMRLVSILGFVFKEEIYKLNYILLNIQ